MTDAVAPKPAPPLPFINVSNNQGTDLLRYLSGPNLTERLGRIEFAPSEISGGYRDMIDLFDYLCDMSPEYGRKHLLFGAAADWTAPDADGHRQPKDANKTYRVELTKRRFSGLYMAFLFIAHHQSPQRSPLIVISSTVFPLARQLHVDRQLEVDLGMTQSTDRRVKLNDDPEWDKMPAEPTKPDAERPDIRGVQVT